MSGQSLVLDALLDDDEDVRRVQQLATVGARAGARVGAVGGPVGAGVGAGVGGAAGYLVGVGVTGVDPTERTGPSGWSGRGAEPRAGPGDGHGEDRHGDRERDGDGDATARHGGPVTIPVSEEAPTE